MGGTEMTNRGKRLAAIVTASALLFGQIGAPLVSASDSERDEPGAFRGHDGDTESSIKYLIVIIGEYRIFAHIFGTYQDMRGQQIWNLLSSAFARAARA